jgi:putative MATE family efflux protein
MVENKGKKQFTPVAGDRRMALLSDGMRGTELMLLYSAIWALAWPAFLAQGIRSLVMFVIRVIVSHMGEKAYNSVNVGLMIFMVILTVIAAVAVGTTAMVAQCWGGGDRARAGRVLQQSLLWGVLLSCVIAIVGMPLSRVLFHLLGADAETIRLGANFMVWLFAAVPFMTPGFFLAAGLRAAGDTRTPMIGSLIMGILAVILAYGLTLGKLGLPALGTVGAALAIGGSFFSFTLFLAILFALNTTILKLPLRGWRLDLEIGFTMFKIGIPSALEWILIQIGILVYVFIIYRYGPHPAAGYFTGMAILVFAQASGLGFQTASATLVGQSVGAQDFGRAESAFRHTALMSVAFMIGIGLIVYLVATPSFLSLLFGELTDESIGYARTFIVLLCFVMPFMGVSFSVAGGLRGAGDTIPPLVASTIGVYGGRIMAAFGLYALFRPPVELIWCSMFPDLILRILVMAVRLKSGKWKRAKV